MVENVCPGWGVWKSEVGINCVGKSVASFCFGFASLLANPGKNGEKNVSFNFFNSVIAESTKLQVSIFICNQFVSGGSSFETLDGSDDGTCC